MTTYKLQGPQCVLDWTRDWTAFLAEGDSIASHAWSIDPDASPSHLADANTATVKVSGLQVGYVYRVTDKITTTGGVTAERSITLRCEEM